MQGSSLATLLVCLSLVPAGSVGAADELELPDDEFLEFLGVWEEVWNESCDPEGGLPGDDACLEYDDEQDEADEK
ncbi:MAG: hypothetical protein OER80_07155 [Gammaproteobacteria bacterium]|nr:hypothetical protein [Gammaproteobacteria bacterium]MDH3766875.1 hypothetical protein [Gammaproteobacteria bacterium]